MDVRGANREVVNGARSLLHEMPAPDDLLDIIRMLPDVVFRCEKREDGKIYWTFNEGRLAEEFHLTTREIEGKSLEDLFPGGASDAMKEHFEAAFRGEENVFVNEMNGRYFKHCPQPVKDDEGRVVAVVGFITEVTEITRAEQEIKKLTRELTERLIEISDANRDLQAFNSTLSHDLRTPLSVIRAQCNLLDAAIDRGETPTQLGERVDKVRQTARRMESLMTGVLELSRVGRDRLERQQVDLTALATAILDDLATADPGRTVRTDVAPAVEGRGDPKLLHQVLQNLIGNAWKYTRERPDATIEFGQRPDANGLIYYVRDNGPGFDKADAVRLFEPFERLHDARRFEGSGIGLATVRKIIEHHGGRVWADSKPGEGATFSFTLGPGDPRPST